MKEKISKNVKKCTVFFALLCSMLICCRVQVRAASSMKALTIGKTYTTTLTGSTKHKVKLTYATDKYGNVEKTYLYIDGKKVKTLTGMDRTSAYLCQLSSGRTLLYIHGEGASDDTEFIKVYEYKKSLKELGDLTKLTRAGFSNRVEYGSLQAVGAKKITVRWVVQPYATGYSFIDVSYTIGTNQITRDGTKYRLMQNKWNGKTYEYAPVTHKWTAARKLTAYTTKGGSKVSFTITSGEKVTIKYVSGQKGQTYLLVRNSKGQVGWLKDPSKYQVKPYFKEAVFAG